MSPNPTTDAAAPLVNALPYSRSGAYSIVLAGVRDAYRVKPGTVARIDLGEHRKIETYLEPVALMWLNEGNAPDIELARVYLAANSATMIEGSRGWAVYVYPTEHPDPLGAARASALEANAPPPAPPTPEYVPKLKRGAHTSRSKRPAARTVSRSLSALTARAGRSSLPSTRPTPTRSSSTSSEARMWPS